MFGVDYKETNEKNSEKGPKKSIFSNFSITTKKVLIAIFVLIILFLVIAYFLYQRYYSNYNYLKKDKSEYLVYTSYTEENGQDLRIEIPQVNIDSNDADLVNEAILDFADSFLTDEDNLIIYDYQVNGKILSLLLKMFDYRSEYDYPVVSFHTYNFDLDEGFLLTDQEVLDLFSTTTEDVSKTIEEKFHEFYDDEVALGYLVPQQCDYQCFLNWRGVDNYMDNVYYYVKNGKLVAYKAFTIYSVFGEEDYFTDSSYEFNIK